MKPETLNTGDLLAVLLFVGGLLGIMTIHFQVELIAIRRELRRLRRQVRRAPPNSATSAEIPPPGRKPALPPQ